MIEIIYEDNQLVVVSKPQGIATTPGNIEDLCSTLFQIRPELASVEGHKEGEGGLLNRLDNETGGLVLFAKSNEAFVFYKNLSSQNLITKDYYAIVHGTPSWSELTVSTPIAHHYSDKRRMLAISDGVRYRGRPQNATTQLRLISQDGYYSLINAKITQGVRHQIRVHLSSIKHPIVSDKIYCKKKELDIPYHLLFCHKVSFIGMDNVPKEISTGYPKSFQKCVRITTSRK